MTYSNEVMSRIFYLLIINRKKYHTYLGNTPTSEATDYSFPLIIKDQMKDSYGSYICSGFFFFFCSSSSFNSLLFFSLMKVKIIITLFSAKHRPCERIRISNHQALWPNQITLLLL